MNNRVGIIVQARMSSSRFPGKVLQDLHGAPMIVQQFNRLSTVSNADQVVVATSTDPTDDLLCEVLSENKIPYFRGDLNNVFRRFLDAALEFKFSVVVRSTADCPLISPRLTQKIIERFKSSDFDYLSNTIDPTFPDGLDVEVMHISTLQRLAEIKLDQAEKEHVTLGIYRRPEIFSIGNFSNPEKDLSDLRWTVDNESDFDFIARVYENLVPEFGINFETEKVLEYISTSKDNRTQRDGMRNIALTD